MTSRTYEMTADAEVLNHWENFLRSCTGEEQIQSPFRVSGPLTQVFNLGVIAQQLGGEIIFDRARKQSQLGQRRRPCPTQKLGGVLHDVDY